MENDFEDSRKLILVVDSNRNDRSMMESALLRAGYNVRVAFNGEQGTLLAIRERPDVVVLDLVAEQRSGFLVIEELRMTEGVPTRIVVVSSNPGKVAKAYAESLGVDAYLAKPVSMTELVATIDRVLNDE